MDIDHLEPVFVELMPSESDLEPGNLYISVEYKITIHLCASGCGKKVALPLNPAQWELRYNGRTVSLSPSVGNWDYPCASHYWIRRNQVIEAPQWDESRIEAGRRQDLLDLDDYFSDEPRQKPVVITVTPEKKSFWRRLFDRD